MISLLRLPDLLVHHMHRRLQHTICHVLREGHRSRRCSFPASCLPHDMQMSTTREAMQVMQTHHTRQAEVIKGKPKLHDTPPIA